MGRNLRSRDIIETPPFDLAADRPRSPQRVVRDMVNQLARYRAFQARRKVSGRVVHRFWQGPPDWRRWPSEAGGAVIGVAG
jgi:hypothetical protein